MSFRMLKNKWLNPPKDPAESFEGRTVIVTGANSGLGFEAAVKFVTLGASKLILAVRDPEKGQQAKTEIHERTGKGDRIEVWPLSLSKYSSILDFTSRANSLDRLDIAILNAGIFRSSYHVSEYGWEEDIQINTLSNTLLGLLLLPKLKETKKTTGVTPILEFVSSGIHENVQLKDTSPNINILQTFNTEDAFKAKPQYSVSKFFLMATLRKLTAQISPDEIIITSICPGAVQTGLSRDFQTGFALRIGLAVFGALFQRTPEQGSRSIVSGTTLGSSGHGRFWQHDSIKPVAPLLQDESLVERIWTEILEALREQLPDTTALQKGKW